MREFETKEDRKENSFPVFVNSFEDELKEAREFWDNFFENVILEEYQ